MSPVPDRPRVRRGQVPDLIFPSDNDPGIPTLLPELQGSADDGPFVRWGSVSRRSTNRGGWHFYTDDYKFAGIWTDAQRVPNSGCRAVVEPNFSTAPGMPKAVALWGIFRKRWLARFWQSQGVRIVVDLNVDPEFLGLNLLGVPPGWSSYATRSHRTHGVETIAREFEAACERAGTDRISFLVFGGGLAVRDACASRGWAWAPEDADTKRGRFTDGKGQVEWDRAGHSIQGPDPQPDHEQPDQSGPEAGSKAVEVAESRQALIGQSMIDG